ncbi:hypothetical protein [Abyssalbus ytuae]|uniref:Uncharacterized protein n=1 Tax=Abyssalbus ytuae TaxID=2926907 RepID=A0A9E7CTS9_9FLAO|nr:hypothetical protein [Abyssalbus ytuae]UOB18611.1 hypothetical protein MQE35_04805 [Abyssalbus ytuae]
MSIQIKQISQGIYTRKAIHVFGIDPDLDKTFREILQSPFIKNLIATQTSETLSLDIIINQDHFEDPSQVYNVLSKVLDKGYKLFSLTVLEELDQFLITLNNS